MLAVNGCMICLSKIVELPWFYKWVERKKKNKRLDDFLLREYDCSNPVSY